VGSARFYFHLASAQRVIHDDQGAELPSLRRAHLHALSLIARTVRHMDVANEGRWTVQIADERGALLLTVMFPLVAMRPAAFRRARAPQPARNRRLVSENTPAVLHAYAAALRELCDRPPDAN
jgi:hypothetical protein